MALSLASPGIRVREVDLTRGGISNTTSISAGIAAPFEKGPVEEVVTITTENELVNVFGKPSTSNYQYESWYSASNFLSYGGSLKVVRCAGTNLKNSNAGVAAATTSLTIKKYDDYQQNYASDTSFFWAAKNPGYWADGLRVCVIDNFADQTITGINTTQVTSTTFNAVVSNATGTIVGSASTIGVSTTSGIVIGHIVNCDVTGVVAAGTTVTAVADGVVTISAASLQTSDVTTTFDFGTQTTSLVSGALQVGWGVTQSVVGRQDPQAGSVNTLDGYLKGIITGIGNNEIYVRVTSHVSAGQTETSKEYTENGVYAFEDSSLNIVTSAGVTTSTATPTTVVDWYNSQNILDTTKGDNTTLPWRSIATRPRTNGYVSSRNGANDAVHVVVIDGTRSSNVSGNPQEILEKFYNLSKASDGQTSPSENIYYKDYVSKNSRYVYAGKSIGDVANAIWNITPASVKFTSGFTAQSTTSGYWGIPSQGVTFNSIGNVKFDLAGGKDYSGNNNIGGYTAALSNITTAYDKLANATEVPLNFILQGATLGKSDEQAKAKYLISIADSRKDCVAFISPYRDGVVNVASASDQLKNTLEFFTPLTSSSYAVFDSGYQYVYDRYNQQFVYMPCSADVAGLCARTDIDQFPWYSPAGKSRGSLKFAIKLAYNPDQNARDQLYSQRINPIISSPGSGIILFGDKTALGYQSAFDRINVRRLFITMEQAIRSAADAQLFEFNDATTRANFINIVEPYLRDIQIKRGITDFLLVCDETNNTPDVIDRNEFIADIYVKPARSINYIGLTFVATRTGVSFQTVVGTV